MATIRQPMGNDLDPNWLGGLTTLTKIVATATAQSRTISDMFNFLRIATATKGTTLKFFADDDLPAGALVYISAASASSEILLSSGFTGQSFINAATAAKGTGNWLVTMMYDGTNFRAVSKPGRVNVRKSI